MWLGMSFYSVLIKAHSPTKRACKHTSNLEWFKIISNCDFSEMVLQIRICDKLIHSLMLDFKVTWLRWFKKMVVTTSLVAFLPKYIFSFRSKKIQFRNFRDLLMTQELSLISCAISSCPFPENGVPK